ncbi:hypothetical protein [Cupriavidus consociatus]|uniref:hypothetical protein n=1 Tax=Cupriavidus consociatus TaxID=2821357 RepID=UPI001AEB777F|nr:MULTISPECIES: hypothetical protein [unclassified Cupriavidus]MBP0620748.1 hypothetical protein [Cupriavidus sp. LEh25]MDK2657408.1 hypothetical protein [Cupriavidus sp. LEh21]
MARCRLAIEQSGFARAALLCDWAATHLRPGAALCVAAPYRNRVIAQTQKLFVSELAVKSQLRRSQAGRAEPHRGRPLARARADCKSR